MSSAAAAPFVLKVVFGDDVHRVPLKGAVDFASVQQVLRLVFGLSEFSAKYEDEEGDLCGLVEATFQDFLATAQPSGDRQLLRLRLFPAVAKPVEVAANDADEQTPEHYRLDAQDSQCASPRDSGSDLDEQEALAMAEQARCACQQVLVNHLQEWLSSEPSSVRFEAWIQEVHPENSKCGAVDPRMYCEAGDHRQIWNTIAAGAPGLTDEEREGRFVASKQDSRVMTPPRAGPCGEAADLQPPASTAPASEEKVVQPTDASTRPTGSVQTAAPPADSGDACVPEGEAGGKHDTQPEHLKKKAARHVAGNLSAFAETFRKRASRTDRAQQTLPQELRPGFELLAEVLQLSGPTLEAVADAAEDVISESIFFGTGVALLTTRAAALPWDSRVLFSRLLCENCPQLLSPCVPACVLAPCCAPGSASAEAWRAGEAAKAAYRQQRKVAKAAYREAQEMARATRRQNAESHRDAMRKLAESHARSRRQAAEAHKAACKAHADAHNEVTAEATAQRSIFALWR